MGRKCQTAAGLRVHPTFHDFVENELLPAAGLKAEHFWSQLASISRDLAPRNRELLAKRDELQTRIDAWHAEHSSSWDHAEYVSFLREIGYLSESGEPFQVRTTGVDPEIARVAGPQLVVPVSNARFALNAANARWGSLYDALYGTDVISEDGGCERGQGYNPRRGSAVIGYAAEFLDRALPLTRGSHSDVRAYDVDTAEMPIRLRLLLEDGSETALAHPERFVGYRKKGARTDLLFTNNGLHIEIQTDPEHPIGRDAGAHVADVVLEAAITTIQDCEDSVAAVDTEDKVAVYRNWLGLLRGTLEASFEKGGRRMTRTLAEDRDYVGVDGEKLTLPERSLMFVRNVGHLMTTDTVLDETGQEVYEGILDAVVTSACTIVDKRQAERLPNSRTGSIYIVKPKMHGPEEVAFTDMLFGRVEDMLGLKRFTLKIGVMDEERRTTVNLEECIRQVRDRIVFINTGFLDRTGDEIHIVIDLHVGRAFYALILGPRRLVQSSGPKFRVSMDNVEAKAGRGHCRTQAVLSRKISIACKHAHSRMRESLVNDYPS